MISATQPTTSAKPKKPTKNPPMGETSLETPPLNPANTGKPIPPMIRYPNTDITARFAPNNPAIKHIAAVCMVIVTFPIDTASQADMQMHATQVAIIVISRAFIKYIPPAYAIFRPFSTLNYTHEATLFIAWLLLF